VHVTLGNADLTDTANTSALVGLSALHSIGQLSANSDQPPVSTSGNGGFALLSKDVLRATAAETNTRDFYDPDLGYLAGATPFSFALGAMDVIDQSEVKTNVSSVILEWRRVCWLPARRSGHLLHWLPAIP